MDTLPKFTGKTITKIILHFIPIIIFFAYWKRTVLLSPLFINSYVHSRLSFPCQIEKKVK